MRRMGRGRLRDISIVKDGGKNSTSLQALGEGVLGDGWRGQLDGDSEGVYKCEIDILREGARTCAVARV